ncbi:MAG: hypothetical protein ACK6BS_21220 [Pseudanabaena sp.]
MTFLNMNIGELLEFVDTSMYAKSGKHLNDLQREIIKGVLDRQKYADIAASYNLSEGHVRDVSYELLQMMSNTFNETIHKGNLESVLERQGNINLSLGDRSIISHIIGYIDFGSDLTENSTEKNPLENSNFSASLINIKKTAAKLRQRGLTDEEIADILDLPSEVIRKLELKE